MARNNTYPKENERKLKLIIKELRAEIRKLLKRIRFLEEELSNVMKPVRVRKKNSTKELTHEAWRKDFVARIKKSMNWSKDE